MAEHVDPVVETIAAKLPTKLNQEWAHEIIDALAAAGFTIVRTEDAQAYWASLTEGTKG